MVHLCDDAVLVESEDKQKHTRFLSHRPSPGISLCFVGGGINPQCNLYDSNVNVISVSVGYICPFPCCSNLNVVQKDIHAPTVLPLSTTLW